MTTIIDVRDAVGLVRDGSTVVIGGSGAGHALPAAVHRRARRGLHRDRRAARPDDGPGRRHRRLRRPRLLAARAVRAPAPDDRQQHRQRAAARRAGRGQRDRVVLVPAGRPLAADARDRRRTAGRPDPGRPGHVRRPAPDRRQAERPDDRGPRRGRHAARPRVAAVPRLPDRRRGHPRHDRRRGRQPDDGGRGGPGRDAGDGHGRPEQRRHRHRPGPPAGDAAAACGCATSRCPGALVDHVYVDPDQWQTYITQDSPYYAGALRRPVRPEPPLPLDVRKIIARRSLLEFPPGAICNLGLRDQPAHRPGGLGGGHHRPAGR